ncbi:hypothetical protein IW248_004534 [Micromonospora ureilytica]|uniref:Uncharacterized protein n=1 Tax=Micromonospora ureilytica TaxID=709868 RepID=A0ABS0JMH1_9ACTN|nr:hypothetical protein [Micromonospora ureilytica]
MRGQHDDSPHTGTTGEIQGIPHRRRRGSGKEDAVDVVVDLDVLERPGDGSLDDLDPVGPAIHLVGFGENTHPVTSVQQLPREAPPDNPRGAAARVHPGVDSGQQEQASA